MLLSPKKMLWFGARYVAPYAVEQALIPETFLSFQDFGLFVSLGDFKPWLRTDDVTQQTLAHNTAVADCSELTDKVINALRKASGY
jgi:hypothetical protein